MNLRRRDFWLREPAPTKGPWPNFWDWYAMLFGAFLVTATVLVNCGVDLPDLSKAMTQSSSMWPLYLSFLVIPILGMLGLYSLMRLFTVGWARQRINESRYYGMITLVLYSLVSLLALLGLIRGLADGKFSVFRLLRLFASDGQVVAWSNQPVMFVLFVLLHLAVALGFFLTGLNKYFRRRPFSHRDL